MSSYYLRRGRYSPPLHNAHVVCYLDFLIKEASGPEYNLIYNLERVFGYDLIKELKKMKAIESKRLQ